MSGKGKGKHNAMKNKYLKNPIREVHNKKAKQERHVKKVLHEEERAQLRDKLLEQALSITGLKKAGLKRIVGTLNVNRLADVVNNVYLTSTWYTTRELRREERKYHGSRRKIQNPKGAEVQGVPAGGSPTDGNSQVDPKRESS